MQENRPAYIDEIEKLLATHTALIDVTQSLHLYFNRTKYGCEKDYPVAIVHESRRIKEPEALAYFQNNFLLDEEGKSYEEYAQQDLQHLIANVPTYVQTVSFMLTTTKEIPHPHFHNKFKHDYWKKISFHEGLEAVIELSVLSSQTDKCEAEEHLRSIIRKRKEVHQLKKLDFVWIALTDAPNPHIETVMQHYFAKNTMQISNGTRHYYVGWSVPLQTINMRYFVCPPK